MEKNYYKSLYNNNSDYFWVDIFNNTISQICKICNIFNETNWREQYTICINTQIKLHNIKNELYYKLSKWNKNLYLFLIDLIEYFEKCMFSNNLSDFNNKYNIKNIDEFKKDISHLFKNTENELLFNIKKDFKENILTKLTPNFNN